MTSKFAEGSSQNDRSSTAIELEITNLLDETGVQLPQKQPTSEGKIIVEIAPKGVIVARKWMEDFKQFIRCYGPPTGRIIWQGSRWIAVKTGWIIGLGIGLVIVTFATLFMAVVAVVGNFLWSMLTPSYEPDSSDRHLPDRHSTQGQSINVSGGKNIFHITNNYYNR